MYFLRRARLKFYKKLSLQTIYKIKKFKKNKKSYYAAIVFILMLFITLFAEVIANDKPLVVSYKGKLFFPIFSEYSAQEFGINLDNSPYYKSDYVINKIEQDGFIIWPLIKFSYDTIDFNLSDTVPAKPSLTHLLGTDDIGKDILAGIIYGARVSLYFGITLALISSFIGVIFGAVQGYLGGVLDIFMQRVYEIWSTIPSLYVLIAFSSLISFNFTLLLIAMVMFRWTALVELVRAEFLKVRNMDFVKSSIIIGQSKKDIIFKVILPNTLTSSITLLPFIASGSITLLSALDFLGIGLPYGSPSLGQIIYQGQDNLDSPWIGVSAFATLAIIVLLLILIGEGIREVFKPTRK